MLLRGKNGVKTINALIRYYRHNDKNEIERTSYAPFLIGRL
jgi:hypothetical protein